MAQTNQGVKCALCNVTVSSPLEIEQHFSGKKHKKRQFELSRREQEEGKAVYVTNLGQLDLSTVQAYFAQFGTICNLNVGWDRQSQNRLHHVIVEFEEEESVLSILKKPLRFNHRITYPASGNEAPRVQLVKVFIREFKARPRSPSPPPCPTFSFDDLKIQLSLHFNLEEQINLAMEFTELTQSDVDDRSAMCANICKTFARNGFPGCVVSPFGSTVNGLGFRGCDLDVYIDLGELPWAPSPTNPHIQIPVTMSEVQRVRVASKLLRQIPQCTKIFAITAARVPIVKFVHRVSGIHCDISFKNRASVLNSNFIRFCTDIDRRVRPLMMTIRLFCKKHDLAGGGGGMRLSNYALTMLVVYYLQQLNSPLLYTVHTLQKSMAERAEMINGWNCAFGTDLNSLPALPVNKQGVVELLAGFFAFYSSLEFDRLALSPFIGRAVDKSTIKETLPEEFSGLKSFLGEKGLQLDKPMCLQDPFELDHNVCKNLPEKAVKILQAFFKMAAETLTNLAHPSAPVPGGLNKLFELSLEPEQVDVRQEKIENITEIFNTIPGVKIYLGIVLPTLANQKEKMRELVLSVMKDALQFTNINPNDDDEEEEEAVEEAETDGDKSGQQSENENVSETLENAKEDSDATTNDVESTESLKRKSDCQMESDPTKRTKLDCRPEDVRVDLWQVRCHVWAGRKKKAELLEGGGKLSVLQFEKRVTEKIMEDTSPAPTMEESPLIVFKTYTATVKGQECVGLEVVESRKKVFEHLFTWLRSYIPDTMKRILMEQQEKKKSS